MASRLQLHEELCGILGSRNVYYQPPRSVQMKYPCIVYSKAGVDKNNANDKIYIKTNSYDGMVIDYDPDSTIADDILEHFPMCNLSDGYTADNLNHRPFKLYY